MRFAALGVFALLLSVQSSASTSEHQPDELSDEAESIYRDVLAKRSAGLVDGGWIHQRLLHAAKAKLDPRNGAVHVADRGSHPGALFELYSMYEAGRNATRDRRLAAALLSAAAERGWPPAQAETGFRHAMGLHNASDVTARGIAEISKPDTPRALLNYYFAARQNSSFANTVMGYRHSVGLGVPKSCAAAVLYYNSAAEDVISSAREHSGFPQAERLRLSHKAISGLHRRREHDVLQYYLYSADLGDVEAQSAVGHILNHGAHGLERNHVQARRYFLRAAEQGDVKAMSHLGHMYANGLGVSRDNATALKWFNKAAARNHPSALYGLGYLHLAGYGVKKDDAKAFNYFTLAAEQNHPESQFHLGVMHLKGWGVKQDRQRAFHYFQLAASTGHALAQYNVAMMQLATDPSRSSCERALSMLKLVAERGPPAEALQAARSHFVAGEHADALLSYLRAAEMGSELGLANAAFMLQQGLGTSAANADWLAMQLFSRSSDQGNTQSLLSVADGYYYGRGVKHDWERAGHLYEKAADRSAQALFNLGYMHQYGAGLEQDLHLAKRYYDLAKAKDADAYLPVQMALVSLRAHRLWESVKPRLPKRLADCLHRTFFSLSEPEAALPDHRVPAFGWLDAVLDYLDWEPQQMVEGISESYDTALLLFLCIGLAVVLRRRQALRQRAAAAQDRDDVQGGVDPVGGWVEDANLRERLRQEWMEIVRQRVAAGHGQQRQPPAGSGAQADWASTQDQQAARADGGPHQQEARQE